MSACGDVKQWIEETVQVPVERVITTMQEACEDFKSSYEESVQQPVESWVSQLQQTCAMQACNWWCLCCNKWLCWMAWVVVKVVTWVVVTVVKWAIYTVCKTVTLLVRIVEMTSMLVGKWVVVFTVCLFTDPTGAALSVMDLWSRAADLAEVLVDHAKGVLGDVGGILLDVESVLTTVLSSIPIVGPVLAGIVRGAFEVLRDVVAITIDVVSNVQDVVFGVGRLDFCRAGAGAAGIGTDIARTVIAGGRIAGGWVGLGIRDEYDYAAVETIVDTALSGALGAGTAALRMARGRVRIGQRPFGLPMKLDVRRFSISSRSRVVNLAALHRAGVLNLWAAAGLINDCSQSDAKGVRGAVPLDHPRWEVVFTGTSTRVDYNTIGRYLREGPMSVPDFTVFAIRMDVLRRYLANAKRKGWQLGIDFTWTMIGEYPLMLTSEIPLAGNDPGNDGVMSRVGRMATAAEVGTIPALAIFGYDNGLNGLASVFRPPNVHPSGDLQGQVARDPLPVGAGPRAGALPWPGPRRTQRHRQHHVHQRR